MLFKIAIRSGLLTVVVGAKFVPCPKTYALGFPNSDVEEDTDSNVSLFADKNMYTKGNLQTSMAPASSSAVVHSVMIGQSLIETQRSSQIVPINDQLSNDTEKQQDEPTQENQKEENHHNDRHTQDSSCQENNESSSTEVSVSGNTEITELTAVSSTLASTQQPPGCHQDEDKSSAAPSPRRSGSLVMSNVVVAPNTTHRYAPSLADGDAQADESDPFPWLGDAINQGQEVVLVGGLQDVKAVTKLAIRVGCRPTVVVDASNDDFDKVNSLKEFPCTFRTRGNLQFGTRVYHSVENIDYYNDEKLEFRTLHGATRSSIVLKKYFIKVDEQHAEMLMNPEYWKSKTNEAARPYVSLEFKTMFVASLLSAMLLALLVYGSYQSTRIENSLLSGLVRGVSGTPSGLVFGLVQLRYGVLLELGCPNQSWKIYIGLASILPCICILMYLPSINQEGEHLGDLLVSCTSVSAMAVGAAVSVYVSVGRPVKTFLWMIACSFMGTLSMNLVALIMASYLALLPKYPSLAVVILSIGFPASNRVCVLLLKKVYHWTVVAQQVTDPTAVPGSNDYGQGLPIAMDLAMIYVFADMGQFMSVILASMSGEAIESSMISVASATFVNFLTRTDMMRYTQAQILKKVFPPFVKVLSPTIWDYIQLDMRYALSWVRFFTFAALFLVKGFSFGNWSFEGSDQFAYSRNVFYVFWISAAAELVEDCASYLVSRFVPPPLKSIFQEHWRNISNDGKMDLSIKKVFDIKENDQTCPSSLLRGVEPMPMGAAISVCFATMLLAIILLQTAIGIESLAGPCEAVVDLNRVLERLLYHPVYNVSCAGSGQ